MFRNYGLSLSLMCLPRFLGIMQPLAFGMENAVLRTLGWMGGVGVLRVNVVLCYTHDG